MKKTITIIMLVLGASLAQGKGPIKGGGDFGLGLVAGEPTGISWKLWSGKERAWDGAVAWSFIDDGYLRLHVDYLWHDYQLIEVERGQLPVYFGVGGTLWSGQRAHYEKRFNLGVRGVAGLEYIFPQAPVDVFLELAPTLGLVPETGFDLQGGIGVRFFF
jgi:hypothetical protein